MRRVLRELTLLPGAPLIVELPVSALVVGLLLWSRFAFLASGPWEWDETLFARGLMWFELGAHFPHPPGFPGWMAIGHLLMPFVSEPLRGLQLASAALSVASLWPLAALGRRAARPAVALAGAMLVLMGPGAWLHSVRGFSSTPATFFLLAAAVAVSQPREQLRPTLATLLISAGFLVRPQLLPAAAVLWLGLAVKERSVRRLLPGVVLSVTAGVVSLVVMASAEGGWGLLVAAFADHASRHFSRLAQNSGSLPDLGLVKAFGGPVGFCAVAVLAVMGCVTWGRRRSRAEALTAAVLVLALGGEAVLLQNRSYTRYTVPFVSACGPLVAAGAAAVAPPAVAVAGLLGLGTIQAAQAWAPVTEQHRALMPGWAAVKAAVRIAVEHDLDVVVEPGLYPFVSYQWLLYGGGVEPQRPRLVLSTWAPEPWTVQVERHYVVATDCPERYLKPLAVRELRFGGVSRELEPLTQRRFLEAAVLVDPPLAVGTWWPVENDAREERFMWGSSDAGLVLPPLPAGTWVRLVLLPARGPAPLEIGVDGKPLVSVDGFAGRRVVWVPPQRLEGGHPHHLSLRRDAAYPPGDGDSRPLAVRLEDVAVVGPRVGWEGSVARQGDRRRLRAGLEGAYLPERFRGGEWGVWLRPSARLRLPAGAGTITLMLSAPRPTPSATRVFVGEHAVFGPEDLPTSPTPVRLAVPPDAAVGGEVEVRIESRPFQPAQEGVGADRRTLGVVISRVSFRPRQPWPW